MAGATNSNIGAGDIQDLAVAVEQLKEETRVLRMAIDELRDDVVWAARQVLAEGYEASGTPPPLQVDPLAPDAGVWDAVERQHSPGPTPAPDLTETAGIGAYCCDQPCLAWNGDPDAPGVACDNCGYVIAEQGSVVMWPADEDPPPLEEESVNPEPSQPQGTLF